MKNLIFNKIKKGVHFEKENYLGQLTICVKFMCDNYRPHSALPKMMN